MVANRFALLSILFALFCILPSQGGLQAQKDKKKDKKEKTVKEDKTEFKGSPEKILELADNLYDMQRFSKAKEAYIEVLKKDVQNYHATYRVAKCSFFIQDYDDASRYFQSAIELDKNANDTVYYELGVTYRILDRHNDALEVFKTFRQKWTNQNDEYYARVLLEIDGCKWVEKIRKEDPIYETKCLDINTSAGDQLPSFMMRDDEKYLVITSHRNESMGNEDFEGYGEPSYSDLYSMKVEDDTTFGPIENIGKPINTRNNDGSVTFSPDGYTMYYSICNQGKLGYGCSIYESKWDTRKQKWTKPKVVEELQGEKEVVVDSRGKTKKVPTYDVHPWLSVDGNTLFFVSDRENGSQGRLDIWYSTYQGEGWSSPVNAGSNINTPFNDISPMLSEDGRTLYFASDGRVGLGGLDLFMAEGGIGSWGQAVNVGPPVNSTYDDWAGVWFHQDSMAYFTSNRPGCEGRDDIFYGRKIEAPPIEVAVHGIVRDKKTLQPVPFATVILFEVDLDNELVPLDTFRTGQTAEYNFQLEVDKEYKVLGNAPEYLANEVTFNTKDLNKDEGGLIDLEVNVDIKLDRIIIEEPIALNNIYYDFDEFFLRPEAKSELDGLSALLGKNPNITIQVGSHTDSNGSENYNKTLSENRAKEAVKYLIEHGVSPDRLKWFGFGESELEIYPEMSDEDEQRNRRSEFRILSIDYSGM